VKESRATPLLPTHLERYFWEYDVERLRRGVSLDTLLLRLMEAGGWDGITWLRNEMGEEILRDFLTRRGGRGVSPKRLRFWGLVLGLPRELVDPWVEAQRNSLWYRRTG